jgi:hypothetical protein
MNDDGVGDLRTKKGQRQNIMACDGGGGGGRREKG